MLKKKFQNILLCLILLLGISFWNWTLIKNIKEIKPVQLKPVGLENFGNQLGQAREFQPVKLEGWGAGWYTAPEYDGVDMPDNALVQATNIDFGNPLFALVQHAQDGPVEQPDQQKGQDREHDYLRKQIDGVDP